MERPWHFVLKRAAAHTYSGFRND